MGATSLPRRPIHEYRIYSSVARKICHQNKNLKSGCALYTNASREKVKQNVIPIFNQKSGVCVIHQCLLYSKKYGMYGMSASW